MSVRRRVGRRRAAPSGGVVPFWHVHWFRRVGDDPFSGSSLYGCRCGVVRPAL